MKPAKSSAHHYSWKMLLCLNNFTALAPAVPMTVNSFSTPLLLSCTGEYAQTYDIYTYWVSSDRERVRVRVLLTCCSCVHSPLYVQYIHATCKRHVCVSLTCVSDAMTLTSWSSATMALRDRSPSTAAASYRRSQWVPTTPPRSCSSVDRRPPHSRLTRLSTLSASVQSSPSSRVRNYLEVKCERSPNSDL